MKVRLKNFPAGRVLILSGKKWSVNGDVVELDDDVAHALIGKHPNILEEAKGEAAPKAAKPKKAPKAEPEEEAGDVDAEAAKMAEGYANKKL